MSLLSSLDLDENLDYRVNMKTYQLFIKPKDRYQLIDKCNIILLEKHGQIYLYFSYNYFLLIIHLKFFILSSNCHNYFLHFATQSK